MTPRKRFLLSLSLWCVVLFATIGFLVVPLVLEIRKKNQEIVTQRKELETMYEKGMLLKSLRKQLANMDQTLPLIEKAILNQNDQLTFITTMENIAEKEKLNYQIQLSSFENTIAKSKTEIVPIPVSIQLRGTYEHIMQALSAFEQTPFVLAVSSLSIEPNPEKNEFPIVSSITMDSFWRK